MKYVLRTLFTTAAIGVLGLTVIALLKYLHPVWWRQRAVRLAAYGVPIVTAVSGVLWMLGFRLRIEWLFTMGSSASAFALVVLLALVVALPVSGLILLGHRLVRRYLQRRAAEPEVVDPGRRAALQTAAAVFPVTTLVAGSSGIARAFGETRVYLKPLEFPSLPPALRALRILHLTDSHLGFFRFLDDFERVVKAARPLKPDLVLLTGDIADDLTLLPGALERAAELKPRLGCFAALGNHEYSRGIDNVLRIFARSPVQLLRSRGTAVDVNGTPLWIAGADDPRYMHGDNKAFLERTVSRALRGAPDSVFRVLLSHRPEGLHAAARHGVELTLAGHTHGGQVGLGGRSFWRVFMPDRFLWGTYQRGSSQLYLSAGMGHWFPFRLGCPTEAPVIELRSGRVDP